MEENSSRKFLLIFTIVSCFSLSCGNPEPKEKATAGEEDSNRVAVETHVVLAGEVADVVKATGTIFPKHDVLISSETAGAIQKVYIELGDWVQKGAPLVQVDPEMKHLALEQATARAAQARAAYEKSQRDFERNEKLLKSQDISEFVFENVRLQKESAEAAYLMAEADVKMARRQLKDTRIVSPVAGFVAHLIAEPGQTVAPGTPIAKVVDISEVKVKFGVPEKDIVKLRKGQEVTISVDSYSGSKFQGTVTAVGPQADLSSRGSHRCQSTLAIESGHDRRSRGHHKRDSKPSLTAQKRSFGTLWADVGFCC
ncbi:MAG: efflux RND transporter periplasmic adaptor subunit [bacterium]